MRMCRIVFLDVQPNSPFLGVETVSNILRRTSQVVSQESAESKEQKTTSSVSTMQETEDGGETTQSSGLDRDGWVGHSKPPQIVTENEVLPKSTSPKLHINVAVAYPLKMVGVSRVRIRLKYVLNNT